MILKLLLPLSLLQVLQQLAWLQRFDDYANDDDDDDNDEDDEDEDEDEDEEQR